MQAPPVAASVQVGKPLALQDALARDITVFKLLQLILGCFLSVYHCIVRICLDIRLESFNGETNAQYRVRKDSTVWR